MQRWGPQPREGILSALLQEFPAYTLSELLAEDWPALAAILDYRRAVLAVELFTAGGEAARRLGERTDLMTLLLEMGRAQGGDTVTLDSVMAALADRRDGEKDGTNERG